MCSPVKPPTFFERTMPARPPPPRPQSLPALHRYLRLPNVNIRKNSSIMPQFQSILGQNTEKTLTENWVLKPEKNRVFWKKTGRVFWKFLPGYPGITRPVDDPYVRPYRIRFQDFRTWIYEKIQQMPQFQSTLGQNRKMHWLKMEFKNPKKPGFFEKDPGGFFENNYPGTRVLPDP